MSNLFVCLFCFVLFFFFGGGGNARLCNDAEDMFFFSQVMCPALVKIVTCWHLESLLC